MLIFQPHCQLESCTRCTASPDGHSRAESEERESETPLGATRRRAATGPVQFTFFRKQKGEDGVTRKVEVDGGDALACDIQQMTNSALRRALIAIDCSAGINTPAPKGAKAKLQGRARSTSPGKSRCICCDSAQTRGTYTCCGRSAAGRWETRSTRMIGAWRLRWRRH